MAALMAEVAERVRQKKQNQANKPKPQAGRQSRFHESDADITVYGGSAGGGKGSPLDSLVVTPYGMRAMGDLEVGNRICSPTHGNTDIIDIYDLGKRDIYRVSFEDGTELEVTGDHIWLLWRARKGLDKKGLKYVLRTTLQIKDYLLNGYHNLLIPLPKPVQFTRSYKVNMRPIDAYVLGVLIGDGSLSHGACAFHSGDQEIVDRVAEIYSLVEWPSSNVPCYRIEGGKKGLRKLGLLNTKSGDKFIPEYYLYAPIDQRWELAKGLFDADGYADDQGHVEYVTVSKKLADDVAWLCRSLGFRVAVSDPQPAGYRDGNGEYVKCQDKYRLYVQGFKKDRLFHLIRKAERAKIDPNWPEVGKRIADVELVRQADARCIKVDNPNGLYIAGNDFIVTHNTYGLLMEPLKHLNNKDFGAVIFRRTYPQIMQEGGMWDEAGKMYPALGAASNLGRMEWRFPSGVRIRFAHLQYDKDIKNLQGAQIALIGIDQAEQFSERQFWGLVARNRSTCGIRPYIKMTCNPDPDSWLASLLSWWIAEDGYADLARAGVKRYFVRVSGRVEWANSPAELTDQFGPDVRPRSVTFIPASVYDNQILLEKDPDYLAKLQALLPVEKERLLGDRKRGGNWKVRAEAGKVFNREWFEIVEAVPPGGVEVRFWDFAATEKELKGNDPAFTAGTKIRKVDGVYYVTDCIARQVGPTEGDRLFKNTSLQDAQQAKATRTRYKVRWEIEPGSAGIKENVRLVKMLAGLDAQGVRPRGEKLVRAKPLAAQARIGNVKLLAGDWNEAYLQHLHNQPDIKAKDIMDSSSGAFDALTSSGWAMGMSE